MPSASAPDNTSYQPLILDVNAMLKTFYIYFSDSFSPEVKD